MQEKGHVRKNCLCLFKFEENSKKKSLSMLRCYCLTTLGWPFFLKKKERQSKIGSLPSSSASENISLVFINSKNIVFCHPKAPDPVNLWRDLDTENTCIPKSNSFISKHYNKVIWQQPWPFCHIDTCHGNGHVKIICFNFHFTYLSYLTILSNNNVISRSD